MTSSLGSLTLTKSSIDTSSNSSTVSLNISSNKDCFLNSFSSVSKSLKSSVKLTVASLEPNLYISNKGKNLGQLIPLINLVLDILDMFWLKFSTSRSYNYYTL